MAPLPHLSMSGHPGVTSSASDGEDIQNSEWYFPSFSYGWRPQPALPPLAPYRALQIMPGRPGATPSASICNQPDNVQGDPWSSSWTWRPQEPLPPLAPPRAQGSRSDALLVERACEQGSTQLGTRPLHPLGPQRTLESSPYSPFSQEDSGSGPSRLDARWYERECVAYARAVQSKLKERPEPEYALVAQLAEMVATFSPGLGKDMWTKALEKVLQDGNYNATASSAVFSYQVQVVTKYECLQGVATVMGCEPWPTLSKSPQVPQRSREAMHTKLARVIRATQQWPSILEAIKDQMKEPTLTLQSMSSPEPPLAGPAGNSLRTFTMLRGARRSLRKAEYLVVEGNMQMVALMLHWHSTHNEPFPHDSSIFFQDLSRAAIESGLQRLDSEIREEMSDQERKDFYDSLRACFDLAVHVSPLVLLGRVDGPEFRVARPKLVDWARELGPKPDFIATAERAIWMAIMDISRGMDPSEAMTWLMHGSWDVFETLQANARRVEEYFRQDAFNDEETGQSRPSGYAATGGSSPTPMGYGQHNAGPDGSGGSGWEFPSDDIENTFADTTVYTGGGDTLDWGMEDECNGTKPSTSLKNHTPGDRPLGMLAITYIEQLASTPCSRHSSPLSDVPDGFGEPAKVASPGVSVSPKASGRVRKSTTKFTEGIVLTQPSAPKKRKRERSSSPALSLHHEAERAESWVPKAQGLMKKEEDSWWKTAYVSFQAMSTEVKGNSPSVGMQGNAHKNRTKKGGQTSTPISKSVIPIQLFDDLTRAEPTTFLFQPDAKSAKFDIPLTQKLVNMVTSRLDENGEPPHWHPTARDPKVSISTTSAIFVVSSQDFARMTPLEIQRVHRHRHILVTDVDIGRPLEFNAEGLGTLADLDAPVPVQIADRKSDIDSESMLQDSTLRDLLNHGEDDSAVAMNCLDLPLGKVTVTIPPCFIDVASDAHSVNLVKKLTPLRDMRDVTSWGTASTKNAVSWPHCDNEGFGTSVSVQAGSKWWALAKFKGLGPFEDEMRDIRTFRDWNVRDLDESKWELEAVHLQPGCVLYMRPCTPHFVLGTACSIVLGRHYYATGCIRRSCFGVVHTFVNGVGLTNTSHDESTRSMLRQLMALWYRHCVWQDGFQHRDAHVPNMRERDGLLDVIAVGCVLEFTTALSRNRYEANYDPSSDDACALRAEEHQGRTWFRVLMKVFGRQYAVTRDDHTILHISSVWQALLVRFAVAVVNYMREKEEVVKLVEGMNATTVQDALRLHLSEDHPHLVQPFDIAVEDDDITLLTWEEETLAIIRKSGSAHHLFSALGICEDQELSSVGNTFIAHDIDEVAAEECFTKYWAAEELASEGEDDSD